jgi:hypothetical protein
MSASLISSAVAAGAEQGYELRITRTFDARRQMVFDAWTKPEMLKEWWGHGTLLQHFPYLQIILRCGGPDAART